MVRRVPFEPAATRASKTLAIRAIELLRSSFLEIDLAAQGDRRSEPGAAPPPAVVHFVEAERLARHPERFGVEVGGAAIMSVDGVGPALLPLVRFDWSPRAVVRRPGGAGGPRNAPDGRERGRQRAGRASVRAAWRQRSLPDGRAGASLRALSAGALHTTVEGRADAPNQGRVVDQWSFLVDVGLGAQLRLPDRFYLSLAAHAQLAEPYVGVRFVGAVVATSARPNLLVTLTIGAWL